MIRRLRTYFVQSLICLITALLFLPFHASAKNNTSCILDDEEYSVIAAVLFRAEHNMAALKKKPYSGHYQDLDGIPSSFVLLSDVTRQEKLDNPAADAGMIADYNRKNADICSIDKKKLQALVPEKSRISFISPGAWKNSREEALRNQSLSSGLTSVSRPGFNADKTRAVMQINHIADFEMGAGYLVYLKKTPPDNVWILTGAVLNRRY